MGGSRRVLGTPVLMNGSENTRIRAAPFRAFSLDDAAGNSSSSGYRRERRDTSGPQA